MEFDTYEYIDSKKNKWFVGKCKKGCQICGSIFLGRINNGLIMAHIVDKHPNTYVICPSLCPNCENSFDEILKPAMFKTITKIKKGKVPEEWAQAGE